MKKPLLITLGLILIIIGAWSFTKTTQSPADPAQVESHVRENISALSPMPEVLGGTFFVTAFTITNENSGVVEYEDGHNAYTADFTFSENDGEIVIDSFVVREQN